MGRRILITGGAGFIGANIAVSLADGHPDWKVLALDNLSRRGSELNLPRLRQAGVDFIHGDVREFEDLLAVGEIDAIVECSAEPSVMAGVDGSPDYLIRTNIVGGYNCLELARRHDAFFVFLSTSRVYPVGALERISVHEADTRFEIVAGQTLPGVSTAGISESFPLTGARTLYGSTKLAVEMLIEEYRSTFDLKAVVNRCGVVAGPWQMGKIDQGVFTYWMLAHRLGRSLSYIGFGGTGRQVRDLIHVADVAGLVERQLSEPTHWDGFVGNVGGGRDCSLSLMETTAICAELTGNEISVTATAASRPGDVPIYVSDCTKLLARTSWRPKYDARQILADIDAWITSNQSAVAAAL